MTIRFRGTEHDSPHLRSLHLQCFPTDEEPGWSGAHWWIGYDGTTPAAFCGIQKSFSAPGYGYLVRAGVVSTYRGLGLQRRMIRLREKFARQWGWNGTLSQTVNWNFHSSNNLARCGYSIYWPSKPWGGSNSIYWRRKFD